MELKALIGLAFFPRSQRWTSWRFPSEPDLARSRFWFGKFD